MPEKKGTGDGGQGTGKRRQGAAAAGRPGGKQALKKSPNVSAASSRHRVHPSPPRPVHPSTLPSLSADPRPPTPGPRLSVAVVGAGRLGTALARALTVAGYEVRAVVARRASHARRAAALIGQGVAALSAAEFRRLPPVDLILLTTPDDALSETAARLAAALDLNPPPFVSGPRAARRVALHASGALASDVLDPLRACGFAVGSLHPLVSVPDASASEAIFRGAFYCVEGDPAAARLARRLVGALGGQSFQIASDKKALYHAAAVMTSGHTVALFDTAARLLARCGLTETAARRVLLPLLRTTLENLSALPPARALTGTYARADASTVRKHLAAFAAEDDAQALALYILLGRLSLRLAEANGADADALNEIARLLDVEPLNQPRKRR